MWTEVLAQAIGQIVDERYEFENVSFAQVDPVRLERVEPIGSENNNVPAGSNHAHSLCYSLIVVAHVLYDFVEEYHIEVVVGIRQSLGWCCDSVRKWWVGFRQFLVIYVDAIYVRREYVELASIRAYAATNVEYTLGIEVYVLAY